MPLSSPMNLTVHTSNDYLVILPLLSQTICFDFITPITSALDTDGATSCDL